MCQMRKVIQVVALWMGVIVIGTGVGPMPDAAAQPALAYDLLFTASPMLTWNSYSDEWRLFLLDTETWAITPLDREARPVNLDALSPDGELLAVQRGDRLCLVDNHWQERFCLPPGTIDTSTSLFTRTIYWSPGGSFWGTRQAAGQAARMLEISADDGTLLTELSLGDEIDRTSFVVDFSPISHHAIYSNGAIYNLDTGVLLGRAASGLLSPDGQQVAEPITRYSPPAGDRQDGDILYILALGDELRQFSPEAEWITWVSPETAWSDTPERVWLPNYLGAFTFWSNDGRMLAVRRQQRDEAAGLWAGTFVYFVDTGEVRFITVDGGEYAALDWSPDDTALAQVLYSPAGGGGSFGLSIATLDGETVSISLADFFTEDQYDYGPPTILSVTWLPRGWLAAGGETAP